jgi:hypothetical protein
MATQARCATPKGVGMERPDGLAHKGINYDVGTNYELGTLSRDVLHDTVMRREIRIIRDELHCNAINVFGTDIERLVSCATAALECDLHVWLQPRLINSTQDEMLDHLSQVAQAAEQLRAQYGKVELNVGCELSVFTSGVIPGRTFEQRISRLTFMWWLIPLFNRRLNVLLARAAAVARSHFNGRTTYAAGLWEKVDWNHFDIVGVNYYRYLLNESGYVDGLRMLHQFGKPVVITEFGCCSYDGAERKGPAGEDIVDWSSPTPQLKGMYNRNERVQAEYLAELIDLYRSENIHGAFVFEFVEPTYPHSSDPRRDLDMASFGIVKVCPNGEGDPDGAVHWEPKLAFHEIARRYGAG